jgi:hypothetical protein
LLLSTMIRHKLELTVDSEGKKLDDTSSFSDIAWHNIQTAAEIHSVQYVSAASIGWLRANPTKRTVDLERELRKHDIPIHLIASPKYRTDTPLGSMVLRPMFSDSVTPTCELLYSCRPDTLAVEEIESMWSGYDENLAHLPEAGVLCLCTSAEPISSLLGADSQDSGLRALQTKEPTNAMMYNYTKLSCHVITEAELNQQLSNDITVAEEKFGQKPTPCMVGMAGDGSAVIAYDINGKTISVLGILLGAEKKTKVIHIQHKQTWKW